MYTANLSAGQRSAEAPFYTQLRKPEPRRGRVHTERPCHCPVMYRSALDSVEDSHRRDVILIRQRHPRRRPFRCSLHQHHPLSRI